MRDTTPLVGSVRHKSKYSRMVVPSSLCAKGDRRCVSDSISANSIVYPTVVAPDLGWPSWRGWVLGRRGFHITNSGVLVLDRVPSQQDSLFVVLFVREATWRTRTAKTKVAIGTTCVRQKKAVAHRGNALSVPRLVRRMHRCHVNGSTTSFAHREVTKNQIVLWPVAERVISRWELFSHCIGVSVWSGALCCHHIKRKQRT